MNAATASVAKFIKVGVHFMHSFLINEVTDAKRLKDLPAWLNRKVADLSPKGESPTTRSRVSRFSYLGFRAEP